MFDSKEQRFLLQSIIGILPVIGGIAKDSTKIDDKGNKYLDVDMFIEGLYHIDEFVSQEADKAFS